MAAREIAANPFAEWLAAELLARDWGVRTLARKIDPDNPEVPRRTLNRYLHEGAKPTPVFRDAIAAAFEIEIAAMPATEEAALSGDRFRDGSRSDVREADAGGGGARVRPGRRSTPKRDAA